MEPNEKEENQTLTELATEYMKKHYAELSLSGESSKALMFRDLWMSLKAIARQPLLLPYNPSSTEIKKLSQTCDQFLKLLLDKLEKKPNAENEKPTSDN